MVPYKKRATVGDAGRVVLSDVPFPAGQGVDVVILPDNPSATALRSEEALARETSGERASKITDEEITAEIAAYRAGT